MPRQPLHVARQNPGMLWTPDAGLAMAAELAQLEGGTEPQADELPGAGGTAKDAHDRIGPGTNRDARGLSGTEPLRATDQQERGWEAREQRGCGETEKSETQEKIKARETQEKTTSALRATVTQYKKPEGG